VAVLRLHAASARPRNEGIILPSEGSVCALWHQNTTEHHGSAELPRPPSRRSSQNSTSTHSVNKLPQEVFTLYLDGVDPGEDDFQELSNLLFGAKERYRSARVTITCVASG